MDQVKEYSEVAERALLVGVGLSGMDMSGVDESLDELTRLPVRK